MKYAKVMLCILPFLAACDQSQDILSPATRPEMAVVRETFEFDSPFVLAQPHPCVEGEFVELSGTVHTEITQLVNDNGNFSVKVVSTPQDVSGFGVPSGATYTADGRTTNSERINQNGSADIRFRNVSRVKSDLPGYDFTVVEIIRFKFDTSGELVLEESTFEFRCQE